MEIKNCSIYPRYEESLPKMSRIPEFALFMYHRHGKSNRVKCLPHSNGQALREAAISRLAPLQFASNDSPAVSFSVQISTSSTGFHKTCSNRFNNPGY